MNAAGLAACPPPARWTDLLDGRVGPAEIEALESHLGSCPDCLALVAGIESAADTGLSGTGTGAPGPGPATLAMLARVARRAAAGDDGREPEPEGDRPAPAIPGLADLREIGRGGMGVVHAAVQVNLGRRVAVKVLRGGAGLDPGSRARTLREARTLARLRHPNIVTVHKSGEVDGSPYLVMEHVEGGTLQDRLTRGVLPFREAADIVRQLARALAEAHALGIVHRDLKPSNILLATGPEPGSDPVPKLADFGLARGEVGDEPLTLTGQVIGTPGYMAPEQTGLAPASGAVGPASDVHGLGCILQALLTGRSPYQGDSTWEVLTRVARGLPDPIRPARPNVPRDLETVVAKCLHHAPGRRYRSAGELADDLQRFLDGRPVAARPVSRVRALAKWSRRRPALATATLLSAVLVLGGVGGIAYHAVRLGRALGDLKLEQGRTRATLDAANRARARSRRALQSLTDEALGRMIERGGVLNDKDQAFLREVRAILVDLGADSGPGDADALRFQARGLLRVGKLFHRIGRFEDGCGAMKLAIDIRGKILAREPGDSETMADLADGEMNLAEAYLAADRFAEGLRWAQHAVDAFRPVAARDEQYRPMLLKLLSIQAALVAQLGRLDEAERIYAEALGYAPTPPRRAGSLQQALWVAACLHNRGLNLRNLERFDEALAIHAAHLAAAESIRDRWPDRTDGYNKVIISLDRLADVVSVWGLADESLAIQARRVAAVLAKEARFPDDPDLPRQKLASAGLTFYLLLPLRREREAESELREAVDAGLRDVAANPATFESHFDLIPCLGHLATILRATGRQAEAIEFYDRIADLAAPWIRSSAHHDRVLETLRVVLHQSATLLLGAARPGEAALRYRRLLELSDGSDRPDLLLDLATALRDAGRFAEARELAEEAARLPGGNLARARSILKDLARCAAENDPREVSCFKS